MIFKIRLDRGIVSELENIGVRNVALEYPLSYLPLVQKGWKSTNAFFKSEATAINPSHVNIGLGNGKASDIFNSGIRSFKVVR